jgi:hypothetical protein
MSLPQPLTLGRLLLLLAAAAALAGCNGGEPFLVPIAGGGRAEVAYTKHGMVMSENDDLRIDQAQVLVTKDHKHLIYLFALTAKSGFVPKRVEIEDVTEDPVQVLCVDDHPRLVRGLWRNPDKLWDLGDPAIKWLYTVDNSIRVYRFIVTGADGQTTTLDQAQIYPAGIKAAFRYVLGLKY